MEPKAFTYFGIFWHMTTVALLATERTFPKKQK